MCLCGTARHLIHYCNKSVHGSFRLTNKCDWLRKAPLSTDGENTGIETPDKSHPIDETEKDRLRANVQTRSFGLFHACAYDTYRVRREHRQVGSDR